MVQRFTQGVNLNVSRAVTFGALLTLGQVGHPYYAYSRSMRGSLNVFEDFVNEERGGLRFGGELHPLRFVYVSDDAKLEMVTNSTANAIRSLGAQFMLGGFSSGLTNYAAKQSFADQTIMLATTAATPSVINQNNLTFGVLPPSPKYIGQSVLAIIEAADACDQNVSNCWGGLAPRCQQSTCRGSLVAGFVKARTRSAASRDTRSSFSSSGSTPRATFASRS